MSFILDALKKLEQNRKRGEVPALSTVHPHNHEQPKKKAIWPYLLLAALLLNAGIFMAWLRPWEEKDVITAQQDTQEIEEAAQSEPANDNSADSPTVIAKQIIEKKEADVSTPEADEKLKEDISNTVAEPEKPVEQEIPVEKSDEEVIASMGLNPTPEELGILRNKIKEEQEVKEIPLEEIITPVEPEIVKPEGKDSFIEFSQLPTDVKKELPDITINGHIYSDQKSARITNINGYITREGDKVASGLILDEITTAGVILSYKEYRFRIRAF
jgi:general secretion pathway protein B